MQGGGGDEGEEREGEEEALGGFVNLVGGG